MAWLLGRAARCLVVGARTIRPAMQWPPPAFGAVCVEGAPTPTLMLGYHWPHQHHEYGLVQACRGLCVSACAWDKHEAQKAAFYKMLQESKDALKKLDKKIQDMLPAKEGVKDQLQKLGDQLATKMDSMSQEYQKEAKNLTGTAKKELEAASKKMKMEADKLREENKAVDSTVTTLTTVTQAAMAKAVEINKTVEPIVKKNMEKAMGEGKKVVEKTQHLPKRASATTQVKSKEKPIPLKKSHLQTIKSLTSSNVEKIKKATSQKKDTPGDAKEKPKAGGAMLKTWMDNFCKKFKVFRTKAAVKMKEGKKKAEEKAKEMKQKKEEKKKPK